MAPEFNAQKERLALILNAVRTLKFPESFDKGWLTRTNLTVDQRLDENKWHGERNKAFFTMSSLADYCGLGNNYVSWPKLHKIVRGEEEPQPPNSFQLDAMMRGKRAEPRIRARFAQWYKRTRGLDIKTYEPPCCAVNVKEMNDKVGADSHYFFFASLDGVFFGEGGKVTLLEIKSKSGTDRLPTTPESSHVVQLYGQMFCAGVNEGYLVYGSEHEEELVCFQLHWNPDAWSIICDGLLEFLAWVHKPTTYPRGLSKDGTRDVGKSDRQKVFLSVALVQEE